MEWQEGNGEEWKGAGGEGLGGLRRFFEEVLGDMGINPEDLPKPRYFILHEDDTIEETSDIRRAAMYWEYSNRDVAQTIVRGPFHVAKVSTIFLFLDHSFTRTGDPVLFETMVFDEPHHIDWKIQRRYSTIEEARAGHKKLVRQLRWALWLRPLYRFRHWLRLPWPKILEDLPTKTPEEHKRMLEEARRFLGIPPEEGEADGDEED